MKLNGLLSVRYVTLEDDIVRQELLTKQFQQYNITPIPIKSKRFAESNDIITGKYANSLTDPVKGCTVSHLKSFKDWYYNTTEDYGFFCEDDLSLETVEHWNFTWREFINNLPSDWEAVQLLAIREDFNQIHLRERLWNDWAITAYILKRDYVKKIIQHCCIGETYNLEVKDSEVMPIGESLFFTNFGKVYTCPLFVENTKINSTNLNDTELENGQKPNHHFASEYISNWWKENKADIKTIMNISNDPLVAYALDTENPIRNFELARWYHSQKQTASAISYYLRAADRTNDSLLAYECLLHMASCFHDQKNRSYTVKGLYQHAINLLPNRPEAYFLLARHEEWNKMYSDSYTTATLGLNNCNFDLEPLSTDVKYPGKYGLIFEKAVCSYWWGKSQECRELFKELKNYDLDEEHQNSIRNNYQLLGLKEENIFDNFDWGTLTEMDIITIEREIGNEKVYDYWRSVKENDIVVDVGSSVGPFVCSSLEKKAKKIYCIEPSLSLLQVLAKNTSKYIINRVENPLVLINKAIVDGNENNVKVFGDEKHFEGIRFKELIDTYHIDKINFLKIDCESGEYNIFIEENMNFLLNNVEFIAMEVHLNYEGCREKFKNFRDNYLSQFKNYKVMSCTRQNIEWGKSIDLKENIMSNEFIDQYNCEFMIYIWNQ